MVACSRFTTHINHIAVKICPILTQEQIGLKAALTITSNLSATTV